MSRRDAERLALLLEEGRSRGAGPEGSDLGDAAAPSAHETAPGPEAAGAGASNGTHDADAELVRLTSLAQALASSAAQPAPRFRAALRERVMTAAEQAPQPAWRARLGGVVADTVAAWRYSGRTAVASGTMTMMLLLAALFVGASLSLPGDPLYAIKDAYQQAQLARASAPADVAAVKLHMAGERIDEAARATDRARMDSLVTSATEAEVLARDAADTLLQLYRETGDAAVVAPLPPFVDEHRPTVADLQGRVADAEAGRALAHLLITLDRIDSRADAALSGCCPPGSQASTFWTISGPDEPFTECACPVDEADEADDDDAAERDGDRIEPPEADEELHDRREEFREGVEDTREGIREGLEDTREGIRDGLEDTREGIRDGLEDTTDDVRDGVDDTTDDVRDGVDDTTEGTRDAVDDALEGLIDGESESDDGVEGPAGGLRDKDDADEDDPLGDALP